MSLDDAVKYSERGYQNRNDAIIDWVITENFITNQQMTTLQRQYQQRGYSKYVDIGVLFGWEGLGSINKVFYDYWRSIGGQTEDPDLNIITDTELFYASCQALNVNAAPLYHFWGEHPDPAILADLNTYPRSVEIYQRLRDIRDFIPKSVEEFQPFFDEHAPSDTNEQDYQNYRDALNDWPGLYSQIIGQIDYIIELYYGSDFDQDGVTFLEDLDDTNTSIGLPARVLDFHILDK